ncbi:MAG: cytochrome c3 family protein, partial [Chloroflexi bacterium]|nr:cytochrome c3 family protein [Chloroflexota bacterium]
MIRRIVLITLGVVLFLTVVGSAATYTLADNGKNLPGDKWFDTQWAAEQFWMYRMQPSSLSRAEKSLDLLSRRLDNIESCQALTCTGSALNYMDFAFGQAVTAVFNAPPDNQEELINRLRSLTQQALALLDTIDALMQSEGGVSPVALSARLQTLLAALDDPELRANIAQLNAADETLTRDRTAGDSTGNGLGNLNLGRLSNPLSVPFPDGAVDHSFFPLAGGHDNLECTNCHTSGDYQGTSPTCVACHAKDEPHEGQYGADCATCHVIASWQQVTFDHTLVRSQECSACHTPPANHYEGSCRACHSDTTDFRNATFNHTTIGAKDCAGCHTPPANHYQGACRACHSDTTDFRNATFNHSGIGTTDCSSCHTPPANHYQGSCRACHSDTSNFRNATFNHSGIGTTDCSSCHTPPANHYQGSCRACHSDTSNFRNATFNH